MSTTYSVDDTYGNQLTTGLQEYEAPVPHGGIHEAERLAVTMTFAPRLRVVVRRVPHATSDCLIRRAIVQRLAPHGHWVDVDPEQDPVTCHQQDLEAARLAADWTARPDHGWAEWRDGPVWVEPFGEGDRVSAVQKCT